MNRQKRNQFLTFVYLAALAHDIGRESRDSQFIAAYASKIPENQIPRDPFTAAQDLIKCFEGGPRRRWMIPPVIRK